MLTHAYRAGVNVGELESSCSSHLWSAHCKVCPNYQTTFWWLTSMAPPIESPPCIHHSIMTPLTWKAYGFDVQILCHGPYVARIFSQPISSISLQAPSLIRKHHSRAYQARTRSLCSAGKKVIGPSIVDGPNDPYQFSHESLQLYNPKPLHRWRSTHCSRSSLSLEEEILKGETMASLLADGFLLSFSPIASSSTSSPDRLIHAFRSLSLASAASPSSPCRSFSLFRAKSPLSRSKSFVSSGSAFQADNSSSVMQTKTLLLSFNKTLILISHIKDSHFLSGYLNLNINGCNSAEFLSGYVNLNSKLE